MQRHARNACHAFLARVRLPMLALALLGPSCDFLRADPGAEQRSETAAAATEDVSAPTLPRELLSPYAQGCWRAASQEQLDRTVLWLSHILIRHQAADNAG